LHVSISPKESVASYGTRFLQLLAEIMAIGKPVEDHWQLTKYIDGLYPSLQVEMNRLRRRDPDLTLDQLMSETEMEAESRSRNRMVPPAYQGIQPKPNADKSKKRCFFCKGAHLPKDCPKIAKRRANGAWKDRPLPNGAGSSS
jgi:hypothetical protein